MKRRLNYRKLAFMGIDTAVFAVISLAATQYMVHHNYIAYTTTKENTFIVILFSLLGLISLNFGGEYRKSWRFIGLKDYLSCAIEICIATIASALVMYFGGFADRMFTGTNAMYYIYWLVCYVVSTAIIIIIRFFAKRAFVTISNSGSSDAMKKAVIIGAGSAGRMVSTELQNALINGKAKKFNYQVIGFVDDDDNIQNDRINGHYVLGKIDQLKEISKKNDIDVIFFAIPSCPNKRKAEILEICGDIGCEVKVVPELTNLIEGQNIISQATHIEVEDLLGRDPVKLNKDKLSDFIKGKTCLVTGGGGSIGSELCRQIMKYAPEKLIIVDIYENNAYDIQQELLMNGIANQDNLTVLIASVRDREKMEKIFKEYTPDYVFHAAAHKHVPLMEYSPEEAVKNNVFGTYNVADLCNKYKVKKFVLISTDKAVNPTNVMGATKRCCEMIMQHFSNISEDTDYAAVRFGNVLGSNGSVIPLFKKQIESGKPVTITHPEIIRYFMTIPEAVSLVLEAGAMAHGGEIFVLDMGEPVKILTLAENLIKIYGLRPYEDVKIIFTGLRPGEKLFEEMLMDEEGMQTTDNNKIFIGNKLDFDDDEFTESLKTLKRSADKNNSVKTVENLKAIVPTFKHKNK